jgi:NAD(P)-dependent dehydrogenase (short-subunit alcohol dehydrogenase family)
LEKLNLTREEITSQHKVLKQHIPLQRLGKANEVAHVVYSQLESSYVTGSVWVVDGGLDVLAINKNRAD